MDKISDKEKGGIMPIKSHFYAIRYRSEFMFLLTLWRSVYSGPLLIFQLDCLFFGCQVM